MKTIEEKAKAYTDSTDTRVFGSEETLDATDLIQKGYIAGATEVLSGQWRSGDEPPEHNHLVFVISDAKDSELRHTTAYYQDGVWCFPDDWYYGCKVLKWMEPPKDENV